MTSPLVCLTLSRANTNSKRPCQQPNHKKTMHLNLNERAYGCTSNRLALAAGQMLRDFGVSSDVSEVRGMKHGAVVAL